MATLTIKKPFDAHVHLRQGAMLQAVAPYTARAFSRAIVMPNTEPPIETAEQASLYKKEILAALPRGISFEPLMALYLTKKVSPVDIEEGWSGAGGVKVHAVKYYPYGATTNSQWGYRSILEAKGVLAALERVGMPLLLHGEVHVDEGGDEVEPYEGEQKFIEGVLPLLMETYPRLKISLEHMSTRAAADFIERRGAPGRLVATVTVHHLLFAKEDIESDPMLRCKPLIKSHADRDAIRRLACRGLPFISAGTDSAPHIESKKRSPQGAFGVFSAPAAVELYAQVFEEMNALDKLEGFLSLSGPRFFGLAPSEETITLEKKGWKLTESATPEGGQVLPLGFGETLKWRISPSST